MTLTQLHSPDTAATLRSIWHDMGLPPLPSPHAASADRTARSPIDGSALAVLGDCSEAQAQSALDTATQVQQRWRDVPAPQRGNLVRALGEELRRHKVALGRLVSLEVGKIESEGQGEVQEMIDICDFAVGLSRQLHGLTIASERPEHRMMEQWHPLGVVAVITAFNFPTAVWAWNAALALVCGNAVVWKPSEKAGLCALAVQGLFERVAGPDWRALNQVLLGDARIGDTLARDPRVALLSATGSTRMGRAVAPLVAQRFGRCLLELGGNNAVVVAPSADLELAVRAIVFGAVGTAGQRCTSTRRVFVHASLHGELLQRLQQAYRGVVIGNPLAPGVLMGPLIDQDAYLRMQETLQQAQTQGGRLCTGGGRVLAQEMPEAWYVEPAIVTMPAQTDVVCHETFAPILYVLSYQEWDEVMALHNAVPQGLSSAIFTNDLREAEAFVSAAGSDCGIANVNLGTSGAEIGGAFGGDKETGGGRESGSDAWRAYMRRATNTINRGRSLPLAQGIRFEV